MKRKFYLIPLIFILNSALFADIIIESGSLLEFIGGTSSTTSYDNYVSHTSEGIASAGYNDYGPDWLDVQTNGFGNYRIIDTQNHTLTHWNDIIHAFLENDIITVDAKLTDSLSTFHYEIVEFTDTLYQRTFYMLREQLNLAYTDLNEISNSNDDIQGSFDNGWGLYIFNPNATRTHVVIEVPHPADDFISPYIATELFLQTDASTLMIAGAGREVKWSESGNYSNNKSLSDPSRNENTVFHEFHKILCDSLMQNGPHSPLVFHVHSFDDNDAHDGFKPIVLSGGHDASNANKPIRDISNDHFDIVNFTAEFPILANSFGVHDQQNITDYYQVHYNGVFNYFGENNTYPIPHTYTLLGPNTGVQMNYLRQYFHNDGVYEPWVQVELHEKPLLFNELDMPLTTLYGGEYPTSYLNFDILLNYYQPFINAVNTYLTHWETNPDVTPPPQIQNLQSSYDGHYYVQLEWEPVFDTNFKSYKIYYDIDEVNASSPFWDVTNDINLQNMMHNSTTIYPLEQNSDYLFSISGIDYFNNESPLSVATTDFIPGHEAHRIIEDFNSGEVILNSYEDQDEDPNSWYLSSSLTFFNSPYSLKLYGNTWKEELISPTIVSDGTVWQVAVYTQDQGEIHGFGVQDLLGNKLKYSFSGSQLLDIDDWVPVYQGAFSEDQWNVYQLPIADDFYAWYDYFPVITKVIYINDCDNDDDSRVYFDEVLDITPVLDISPEVSISYSTEEAIHHNNGSRSITVQFTSNVIDDDSELHIYNWSFGDGNYSNEINPTHTFTVFDNHEYTVLLQVVDESDHWGVASTQISIDDGESTYPIKLNFIGDIMLGRRYEEEDGIIETSGVESIFEPTINLLGESADLTIANLECPMTNFGTEHPTKSVVFKSDPDNIDGLIFAGIDIVSLANNHSTDYGLTGLEYTQYYLDQNNILYSGAGANSYEAYEPLFVIQNGVNIAFLANSDRTGQYNNYQPYLQSGYNKPGFAYMTPYYMLEQIEDVQDVADLIVFEMHAGSEYSFEPGADYDNFIQASVELDAGYLPPEETIYSMDIDDISDEDENYSPNLDIPHMWDREIRHFAIDSGADLVIIHHPHILQGFEVYNGKVIAHSLGNFVFDLNYPETYPTAILNAEIDESGFNNFSVNPIYLDDYIPYEATGGLGLHILDYVSQKSKELDTYVFVDRETNQAHIILDSLSMPETRILNRKQIYDTFQSGDWLINPINIHETGSLIEVTPPQNTPNSEFRLGRDLLFFGNMEDEGCSLWNTNSEDEWFNYEETFSGNRSLIQRRTPDSGDNIITNFEDRIKIKDDNTYSLQGFIKTQNASNVTIQIRFYTSRTTSNILGTDDINVWIDGTTNWTQYHNEFNPPNNAKYFDIRLNSDMPNTGEAFAWFDNVSVIEWSDWSDNFTEINTPNDYYFVQLKNNSQFSDTYLEYHEVNYANLGQPFADFSAIQSEYSAPAMVQFNNESSVYTGWFEWDFGDGNTSSEKEPSHTYLENGQYTVSLTILDYNEIPITTTINNFIILSDNFTAGDVNLDTEIDILDIVLMVNMVINGTDELSPTAIELADINNDNYIDILDIVTLVNIILEQ